MKKNKFINNTKCFILALLGFVILSCNNNTAKKDDKNKQKDTIGEKFKLLNEEIEKHPNSANLYHERAKLNLKTQNMSAALEDMNKVMQIDSTKAPYFITLSDIYFSIGKAKASKLALEKCLTLDSKNTDAMLKLAELDFYFKQYKDAIEYTHKALEINKDLAKAYFIKGMVYKENGDTATSIKSFQITTEIDPEYFKAYEELGIIYSAQKNRVALDYFKNALKLNPKSIEVMYAVGLFYQEIGEYQKAIETYQNILKINMKYSNAYYNIGFIYFNYLNDNKKSLAAFTDAARNDSTYAEAYYMRGLTFERIGDKKNAYMDFQKTLQLNSNFPLAVDALNRLESKVIVNNKKKK